MSRCFLFLGKLFSSGKHGTCKRHFFEENVNLCWDFAKGTTAKAQGTTAIDVGAVGQFKIRSVYASMKDCLHHCLCCLYAISGMNL